MDDWYVVYQVVGGYVELIAKIQGNDNARMYMEDTVYSGYVSHEGRVIHQKNVSLPGVPEQVTYDEDTLVKVRDIIANNTTADRDAVTDIIRQMQNAGLLFRERAHSG